MPMLKMMPSHATFWTCLACLLWLPSWIIAQHRFSAPYPYQHRMQQHYQQPMPLYIPYPFQNVQPNSVALNSVYDQQSGQNDVTDDDGETTTDQNGGDDDERTPKSEKLFGHKDESEQFFIIHPADAAAIALLNIVGIIMMALGSTVTIVGRRSLGDQEDPQGLRRIGVIMEGLRLGSNGSHQMCVQRAACQAPQKAEVVASAAHFLIDVVGFGVKWIPISPSQLSIMAAALHSGATSGNAGLRCPEKYPCSAFTAVT